MITEDFVSFETAKLLKEKGFDDVCRAFWKDWYNEKSLCECYTSHCFEYCTNTMLKKYNDEDEINIAAPTLQMAMKWLRKKYEYIILFDVSAYGTYDWYYIYKGNRYHYEEMTFNYNEMEEACEAAIKYCLENLI